MMNDFESGLFFNKIPFVRTGEGENTIVIFLSSEGLLFNILSSPAQYAASLRQSYPLGYQIVALGYDQNLPAASTSEQIAGDLKKILSQEIGPAIIVAVSFGGMVAIPFAAKYPQLVKKLVLAVTAHSLSESGLNVSRNLVKLAEQGDYYKFYSTCAGIYRVWWLRWFSRFSAWKQWKNPEKMLQTMNSGSTFINAFNHLFETVSDRKKYLPQIQAPTLVLGGTADVFFSEEIFRETAERIPNAQLTLFESGGHMLAIEKKRKYNEILFDFIDK